MSGVIMRDREGKGLVRNLRSAEREMASERVGCDGVRKACCRLIAATSALRVAGMGCGGMTTHDVRMVMLIICWKGGIM